MIIFSYVSYLCEEGGDTVIYDMRIYEIKPGTLEQYMAAVREVGLPVREAHGVKLAGWYYTEIGPLNQVVHIWGYQDMEDMDKKMEAVRKDPRWVNEYVPRVQPLLVSQSDQIMSAADYSP